jgi:hypothetical protein
MRRGRAVYQVRFANDLWSLEGDRLAQPLPFKTRAEAVAEGRRLAEQQPAGELLVHHCDGSLARQYRYHGEPRPSVR